MGLVAIATSAAVTTTTAAAAVAATAAAATATTAATAAATVTASTAATRTFFAGTRFIYGQRPAIMFLAVQFGNRLIRFVLGGHLNKRKTAGFAGHAIDDHVTARNRATAGEQLLKVALGGAIRQVAYIQFRCHLTISFFVSLLWKTRGIVPDSFGFRIDYQPRSNGRWTTYQLTN